MTPAPSTRGLLAAGDRVLLVDARRRRHLITLAAGGEFHSHAGILRHDDLIGGPEGVTVSTTLGARLVALRPTLSDYVLARQVKVNRTQMVETLARVTHTALFG